MKPNFENYTIAELHESLSKVDKEKYPENVIEIENHIKHREENGFNLSGEVGDTTINQHKISLLKVALPVWWRFTWRYGVATTIISMLTSLPLFIGFSFFGHPEYMFVFMAFLQIVLIPIAGMFFIRQAMVGKYKNFHIQIMKKANKPFERDVNIPR